MKENSKKTSSMDKVRKSMRMEIIMRAYSMKELKQTEYFMKQQLAKLHKLGLNNKWKFKIKTTIKMERL